MSSTKQNPLLASGSLPAFSKIRPAHVVPGIEQLLGEARALIGELTMGQAPPTWQNLIEPMEEMEDRINKAWSPVSHLHAVADNPALREAYNTCLAKLSDYSTEFGQNQALYEAYKAIASSDEYTRLDQAQRKTIDNALRDFRLAGVALSPSKKKRYKKLSQRLSELASKFNENVLDATQGWKKNITDPKALSGLPETTMAFAKQTAEREQLEGWLLTLEAPSYVPVLMYADDENLRREMYEASTTRASDQGPNAGLWDNTEIIDETLALRHEKAQLLGFGHFAEYSLATKMARGAKQVIDFLEDLGAKAKVVAERDLAELKAYASEHYGVDTLRAWDIAYYSEKLRAHRYDVSQEALRPYFPVNKVRDGLFAIVGRLYGLKIAERDDVETWHEQVSFFEIRDESDRLRGQFYLDLYARPHKRGGAWMDECRVRRRHGNAVQTPVAYLICNFTPPVQGKPSLLSHDEVTTFFHEFGHGLHHLLSQIDYPAVSGINGVEWDAVELPSQFMENWCWEREAVHLISGHYETGEPLPDGQFDKLYAAKNFQSGLKMIRQLEFALFDFRLHMAFDPSKGPRVQETLAKIRRQIAVIHPPAFNRFAHSFSHVFGGGYAAGYYSYLWAEVLAADAYSLFEQTGIFDQDTGRQFLHHILEQGGSRNAMDLFVAFRGREPNVEALLRHSGIAPAVEAGAA